MVTVKDFLAAEQKLANLSDSVDLSVWELKDAIDLGVEALEHDLNADPTDRAEATDALRDLRVELGFAAREVAGAMGDKYLDRPVQKNRFRK